MVITRWEGTSPAPAPAGDTQAVTAFLQASVPSSLGHDHLSSAELPGGQRPCGASVVRTLWHVAVLWTVIQIWSIIVDNPEVFLCITLSEKERRLA